MLFTAENNTLNKNLHQFKEYGSQRILTEFSEKNWKNGLKKIRETRSTDQRHKCGKPKHVRSEESVTAVDNMVLSGLKPVRPDTDDKALDVHLQRPSRVPTTDKITV